MNKRHKHKSNIKNYSGTSFFLMKAKKHKMNKRYVHQLNIFGVHKMN
jgi:hypothetical protein